MKKLILIFLFLLSLTSCEDKTKQVSNVQASSYIVIEQSNNKILEGNNYDTQRSVASISKIMTAIVTIENIDINTIVKVPNNINKVYGSSIYLKENQEISIEKLLYGLMLRSGNDAAITLAMSISNSVEDFVLLMNKKAEELNLKNTYFSNPHGLDEEDNGNVSSAYDMALLYSYCMKNKTFAKITSSQSYGTYINKNKLIRTYPYCTGGKTGFTKKAKRTLISSASKDDINLIVVTLNCGNDFQSHKDIYEHYFNNYKAIRVLNKGENSFNNVSFYSNDDYYMLCNNNDVILQYRLHINYDVIEIYLLDNKGKIIDYLKIDIRKKEL
jgi:D-alanyl-D-alanine carboxypeptidase